jgi:hypothetical protein
VVQNDRAVLRVQFMQVVGAHMDSESKDVIGDEEEAMKKRAALSMDRKQ